MNRTLQVARWLTVRSTRLWPSERQGQSNARPGPNISRTCGDHARMGAGSSPFIPGRPGPPGSRAAAGSSDLGATDLPWRGQ